MSHWVLSILLSLVQLSLYFGFKAHFQPLSSQLFSIKSQFQTYASGEGFGREPSPLNIPNSGKSPKRKKGFWEQQNSKVRDKTKNDKYVYLKHKGHSSVGDGRHKLGYRKPAPFSDVPNYDHLLEAIPAPTAECGCNSKKSYRQCCGIHHQSIVHVDYKSGEYGPTDILQARYSAYKYGLSKYIIESTHPKNQDYVKFVEESQAKKRPGSKRWERDIMSMCRTYKFLGFEVVDVTYAGVGTTTCQILFRTLLKQREDQYDAGVQSHSESGSSSASLALFTPLEERATFLQEPATGRWLYYDGETVEPDRETASLLIEKYSQVDLGSAASSGSPLPTTHVEQAVVGSEKDGAPLPLSARVLRRNRPGSAKLGLTDQIGARARGAKRGHGGGLHENAPVRPFRSTPQGL